MNNYYVYEYTRLDTNEVFYVGKGTGDRYKQVSPGRRNKHFLNVIKSIPYKVELVLTDLSEADAFQAEMFFICHYRSLGQVSCNFTNGGEGCSGSFGRKFTEEHKQKLSNSKIGKKLPPFSKEHKQKLSESKKGNKNPRFGTTNPFLNKTHSLETRQKMSETAKNRKPVSDETRRKLSEATTRQHQLKRIKCETAA